MRFAILLVALSLQAPLPPEDYPGQRNHEKPPDGWFCSANHPHPAHNCSCVRLDTSQDCEGTPNEDRACKVWCHRAHCKCPIKCMPAAPPTLPYPDAPEDGHEAHK